MYYTMQLLEPGLKCYQEVGLRVDNGNKLDVIRILRKSEKKLGYLSSP